MVTKQDKLDIISQLKAIDVKKLEIAHDDDKIKHWFRFGNFNALQLVAEIIKNLPEETTVS